MKKPYESTPTEGYTLYRHWKLGGFEYRSDLIAGDYMRRWTVQLPWGMLRLHHVLRSDDDRHFHDHPMDFCSLILWGGYVEFQPGKDPRSCPPGTLVAHRAEDLHFLKLRKKSSWSFLVTTPRRRRWGFQTEEGWVDAGEYDAWKRAKDAEVTA